MLAKVVLLCAGAFAAGMAFAMVAPGSSGDPRSAGATPGSVGDTIVAAGAPLPASLDEALAGTRVAAGIEPSQEAAWERFAAAIRTLDAMTRAFEARVAAGDAPDRAAEEVRHTLTLGAATADLAAALTPVQMATVRRFVAARTRAGLCLGTAS